MPNKSRLRQNQQGMNLVGRRVLGAVREVGGASSAQRGHGEGGAHGPFPGRMALLTGWGAGGAGLAGKSRQGGAQAKAWGASQRDQCPGLWGYRQANNEKMSLQEVSNGRRAEKRQPHPAGCRSPPGPGR